MYLNHKMRQNRLGLVCDSCRQVYHKNYAALGKGHVPRRAYKVWVSNAGVLPRR